MSKAFVFDAPVDEGRIYEYEHGGRWKVRPMTRSVMRAIRAKHGVSETGPIPEEKQQPIEDDCWLHLLEWFGDVVGEDGKEIEPTVENRLAVRDGPWDHLVMRLREWAIGSWVEVQREAQERLGNSEGSSTGDGSTGSTGSQGSSALRPVRDASENAS